MTEQEKRIQEQTKDAIEVLGFLKTDFENKAKPRCKFARVRAGLFFGIKALEEVQQYRAVGTVEEFKALKEKDTPYKPEVYEDRYYGCKCGNILLHKWLKYPTELMPKSEGLPHCLACGQKLDWE